LLIAIDIGNTNVTAGLFRRRSGEYEPLLNWRFTTLPGATADELAAPLLAHLQHSRVAVEEVSHALVASVVPELDYSVKQMLRSIFGVQHPEFISAATDTGLGYAYPVPSEIGADRIVNAAAGVHLYGAPLIIIDFGTATTFCCISEDRKYLGGQIMPGVGTSLRALTSRAAKLFDVRIRRPESALGQSTSDGLVSGIYYQTIGAVEKALEVLKKEMQGTPRVLATGGLAGLFEEALPGIDEVDMLLTLRGLKIIHDRLYT
jgi:type III pantothenate kinase